MFRFRLFRKFAECWKLLVGEANALFSLIRASLHCHPVLLHCLHCYSNLCGRTASSEVSVTSPLRLKTTHEDNSAPPASTQRKHSRGAFAPILSSKIHLETEDIRIFRNVHLVERYPPIGSVEEAERTLERDPSNPNASQYLGWHLLQSRKGSADAVQDAITWLKRSISQGNKLLLLHTLSLMLISFRCTTNRKLLSPWPRLHGFGRL